jgi:hypothetical protein
LSFSLLKGSTRSEKIPGIVNHGRRSDIVGHKSEFPNPYGSTETEIKFGIVFPFSFSFQSVFTSYMIDFPFFFKPIPTQKAII